MQGESLIAGSDVSRGDPRQGAVPAGWAEPGDQSATAQTERKTELLFLKPKKLGAENRSTRSTTPSLRQTAAPAPDFISNFIMMRRGFGYGRTDAGRCQLWRGFHGIRGDKKNGDGV